LQEYETTSKTDDDSFPEDSALLRWIDNLNKAAATFGKPTNIAPELKQHLIDAGFAGVEDYVYKVRHPSPLGPLCCLRFTTFPVVPPS
jgi:hypothetical protein